MNSFFSSDLFVEFFMIVLLSMVVGAISITITKSSLFKSLRNFIEDRNDFFGKLVTCPYCTGHWIAFLLVVWYQPRPLNSGLLVIDLTISAFMMITLGSLFAGFIFRILSD